MSTDQLWQQFFYHLKVKRRSKATLRYYACTQRVFGRFLTQQGLGDSADITVAHLRAFLVALEAQGLRPGGIHGHARALRALFNWAFAEELIQDNPARRLELPSVPKERLPAVTCEVITALLSACKGSEQPLRDKAMVLTLFDTGIRLQELVDLRLENLLFDRGLIRVVGKGNKERFVPLGSKAMHALTTYIRRERKPSHAGVTRVFLGRSGADLTKSGVSIRLLKLATRLGLPRETCAPHAFRRGFAVEFLRNGGDVFTLQQIMGHTNLEMTRRYVFFLDEDLKRAHTRFSPVDNL